MAGPGSTKKDGRSKVRRRNKRRGPASSSGMAEILLREQKGREAERQRYQLSGCNRDEGATRVRNPPRHHNGRSILARRSVKFSERMDIAYIPVDRLESADLGYKLIVTLNAPELHLLLLGGGEERPLLITYCALRWRNRSALDSRYCYRLPPPPPPPPPAADPRLSASVKVPAMPSIGR